jgi:hypothetical protein
VGYPGSLIMKQKRAEQGGNLGDLKLYWRSRRDSNPR